MNTSLMKLHEVEHDMVDIKRKNHRNSRNDNLSVKKGDENSGYVNRRADEFT